MAVVGLHGEVAVCFGEDGYFHPVVKDENGYDVPSEERLKSVNNRWETFDTDDQKPHNEFYASNVQPIVPGEE